MQKTYKQPTGTHEYNGKQYNVFRFYWPELDLQKDFFFVRERYADNGTLAIEAYEAKDEELFCDLTVNLRDPRQVQKNHAFFDANNSGWMEDQLKQYGLMERVKDKYTKNSGYVTYPLYKWNIDLFRVGGEKPKYYVDFREHRDGETFGSMSWSFEDKPDTETEDIEAAKRMAEEAILDFPYDENDEDTGIIELYVVDQEDKELYSVVNVSEKTAGANGIKADKYIEVKAQEQ